MYTNPHGSICTQPHAKQICAFKALSILYVCPFIIVLLITDYPSAFYSSLPLISPHSISDCRTNKSRKLANFCLSDVHKSARIYLYTATRQTNLRGLPDFGNLP